jgi:hypothetical protein
MALLGSLVRLVMVDVGTLCMLGRGSIAKVDLDVSGEDVAVNGLCG